MMYVESTHLGYIHPWSFSTEDTHNTVSFYIAGVKQTKKNVSKVTAKTLQMLH